LLVESPSRRREQNFSVNRNRGWGEANTRQFEMHPSKQCVALFEFKCNYQYVCVTQPLPFPFDFIVSIPSKVLYENAYPAGEHKKNVGLTPDILKINL
jgi:hypothetical protein